MERGYYWLQLKNQDPEVVEIDGNWMYRCGSDVGCYFDDGKWYEGAGTLHHLTDDQRLLEEPMDVVFISGPILAPNA